jgi:aryl-alcohol dehydrogenase-like predicted oxidoreductase
MIHAASLKLSPRRAFDLDVDRPVVDAVRRVAESRGIPMSHVALAWLLTKPVVSAPIVGATKSYYLSDAAAAHWRGPPSTPTSSSP